MVVLVALANLPALTGHVDANPLLLRSGLGQAVVHGGLPGFYSIDPNDGFTLQALGHLAALDWTRGIVPWWNPYEGLGAPLAGEMQSAAFFPPVLLELLFSGVFYYHLVLEELAAIATFLLLRRLGLVPLAALIGGVAFGLNGTFAWLGNAVSSPIAFLPCMLLAVEFVRGSSPSGRWLGAAGFAASLALSIYAGFPETTALDALLVGVWVLLRLQGLEIRRAARYLASLVGAGVIGLLLAAPIIDAFLTYLPHADIGGNGGAAGVAFLSRTAVATLAMPYVFGPIFAFTGYDKTGVLGLIWSNIGGFTTVGVLLLAAIAVWASLIGRRQRLLRLVLAGWVLFAWAKTFGLPVLNTVVGRLPGMADIAFYRYAPPTWELALIVLAAMGLDDFVRGRVRTSAALAGAASAGLVLALGVVAARHELARVAGAPPVYRFAYLSIGLALGIWLLVAAAIALPGPARRLLGSLPEFWVAALVLGEVVAMFGLPQLSAPVHGFVDMGPVRFLQTHLGDERFATLGPIAPDYGSYFGLAEINVNDLPVPAAFANFVATRLDQNVNPIIFTGTTRRVVTGPSPLLELTSNLRSYELAAVKYLVTFTVAAQGPALEAAHLTRVFADSKVTIYELPHPAAFDTTPTSGCRLVSQQVDRATVDCAHPGTLLRRELYFPGWAATENGRPVAIRPYDRVFQMVDLPAGSTTVRFTFQPPHLAAALAGLAAGLLGLLGCLGAALLDRRRAAGAQPAA